MRSVFHSAAILLSAALLSSSVLFAQSGALSISNYQLVSEQRLTREQWFRTYKADLVNTGQALTSVTATVSSLSPSVKPVAGQNTLHFAPVPANGRVTSTDTFTILVDNGTSFDFGVLQWTFGNPVANPSASQTTAAVGATIFLNGAGSSNPSGIGTLSYSWAFASKPKASSAAIANPSSISASFVIDAAGEYVVNLTVNNGAAQDTRSVKISTINSPPVARAGSNQKVAIGATALLDGSASSDADGDALQYQWTFVSVPLDSNAVRNGIGSFRSPLASFVADVAGDYIVQLAVTDGVLESTATVKITAGQGGNTPPVANAGANQSNIDVGATVQLSGSGTDVDNDALTYKWTLPTRPTGSAAQLSRTDIPNPTFVADKAGTYVAQLVVNDGKIDSNPAITTIVTKTVTTPGAPTANAGPNQTVTHGATVLLKDATASDPLNLPLTFKWVFNSKPAGSNPILAPSDTVLNPSFVASQVGQYILQLTANNGTLPSQPSTITITTTNTRPVANAGADQTVNVGTVVSLNGAGSTDADNDPLSYSWTLNTRPNGSTAALSAANSKTPTFVPDVAGVYKIQLMVNDGFTSSDPASDPKAVVTITVNGASGNGIVVPASLTVAPQQTVPYNISLSQAAASDVSLELQNSNSALATLSTSAVVIQAGQTQPSRQVFLTGLAKGSLTITVSAPGRNPATTNVTVGTSATLSPASLTIPGPNSDGTLTITLNGPAQSDITFTVKSSNLSVVTAPGIVPLAAGSTSTAFKVFRAGPGSGVITVSAPGFADMTSTVTVDAPGGITLSTTKTSLNLWEWQKLTVTLSAAAPAGGAQVSFVADSKYIEFSQKTLNIAQGATTGDVQIRGVQLGNPLISATAPGYSTATPLSLAIGASIRWRTDKATFQYDVRNPQRLELILLATVPGGVQFDPADAIVITLSSTRPEVANFLHASAMFLWDGSTEPAAQIPINILGAGTTILKAKGLNIPEVTMTVVVSGPLAVTTASLPDGNAGLLYSAKVEGAGGAAPYTWSASGLPPNLTINPATGQITGTPVSEGTYTVNVTLKDSSAPQLSASATLQLKINKGVPASITAAAGSNQSAKINTAFGSPLKAMVKDVNGNPLSGVTVTFSVQPAANGSTGSFAGNQTTAVTDATGVATSATLTANGKVGVFSAAASAPGPNDTTLTTSFTTLTITAGDPASITVSSGSPQSVPVGSAFAPFKALVKDSAGNAASNVSVTFTAPASGATGTFPSNQATNVASTDSNGIATSAVFTANNTVGGPYNIVASVSGVSATASFALTNTAGVPASIAVVSGSPQSAMVRNAFEDPLKVIVKNDKGLPITGFTVAFSVIPGANGAGATFGGGQTTAVTDSNGIATSPVIVANSKAGTFHISASAGATVKDESSVFTNTSGPPVAIEASAGAGQSAELGQPFALPLKATVKDSDANPVPNVSVTFTAPASGASALFAGNQTSAVAITDANGIATAPALTANLVVGNYSVSAVLTVNPGVSAAFALTNKPGKAASVAFVSGAPQSAQVSKTFASPMQVVVKDVAGKVLTGVTVTFSMQSVTNGASATFVGGATAVSDSNGIATSSAFTANNKTGTFKVAVTAGEVSDVSALLTNTPGDPAKVEVVSGNNQTAEVDTQFGAPLVVRVKDAFDNLTPGATVTFAAPASGAGAGFVSGNTAVADAAGVATSSAVKANTIAGSYAVSASSGAGSASFSLTNRSGAAAAISVAEGSPQSAAVGSTFSTVLKALAGDKFGNPVSGVTITFIAPSGNGAGGSFAGGVNSANAVSNSSGIATAPLFTANTVTGTYAVTASSSGLGSASFQLTNVPGTVATLEIAGGSSPQSAAVNTVYASPLKVLAKDKYGNLAVGATIDYTAPASGASGTFQGGNASAIVDPTGVATSAPFKANCKAGLFTVTAYPAGVQTTAANFILTNLVGSAAAVAPAGGGGQTVGGNNELQPLMAAVSDSCGNLLPGVNVTFVGPSSGPGLIFANGSNQITVPTGASGIALAAAKSNAKEGSYSVVATAAGVPGSATFTLTNDIRNLGCDHCLIVNDQTIGKNLQDSISVTLDPPAPAALPLTIAPRDSSKALVANGFKSITMNLAQGTINQSVAVQALTDSGEVVIDISAPGYMTATSVIKFAPSGFVMSGPNGVGANFDVYQGSATQLSVFAARLDAQGNFAQTQQVRVGLIDLTENSSGPFTVRVPISKSFTSGGTSLTPMIVSISGGTNSATLDLKAGANEIGNVTISAESASATLVCNADYLSTGKTCPLPGFAQPASGNQVTAVMKTASMVPFSAAVGKNLEKAVRMTLTGPATTAITVTLTSADPSKMKFAKKSTDLGSASIDVVIPVGFTLTPDFYVQAFEGAGTVGYTASAPGVGSVDGKVTLMPSGLAIQSPGGLGAEKFQIGKGVGNATLYVFVGPVSGGALVESQPVAPGRLISVNVTSSSEAVGTISISPIIILPARDNEKTEFRPLNTGETTIFASADGYGQVKVTATVLGGSVAVTGGIVGKNLQSQSGHVSIPAPAGVDGATVTVHSNSQFLKLALSETDAGSDTVVLAIAPGELSGNFWIQGFTDSGTATMTASSAGFAPGTGSVTFVPSSIVIYPNVLMGNVNGTGSASIFPVALVPNPDGGLPLMSQQQLAGAGSVDFSVVRASSPGIADAAPSVYESDHPYPFNTTRTWNWSTLTAQYHDITFDAQTSLGPGDSLIVSDGLGKPIAGSPFTGKSLAGKTVRVSGSYVQISLVSDARLPTESTADGAGWGFKVSKVVAGGSSATNLTVRYNSPGTASFSVTQPVGFTTPPSYSSMLVQVLP